MCSPSHIQSPTYICVEVRVVVLHTALEAMRLHIMPHLTLIRQRSLWRHSNIFMSNYVCVISYTILYISMKRTYLVGPDKLYCESLDSAVSSLLALVSKGAQLVYRTTSLYTESAPEH